MPNVALIGHHKEEQAPIEEGEAVQEDGTDGTLFIFSLFPPVLRGVGE